MRDLHRQHLAEESHKGRWVRVGLEGKVLDHTARTARLVRCAQDRFFEERGGLVRDAFGPSGARDALSGVSCSLFFCHAGNLATLGGFIKRTPNYP